MRRISQDGLSHHLSSPRSKFSHFVYLFHFSPLIQDTNLPVLALHFWFTSQLNALFVQLFMFCDYNFIQQHQNALLSALIHRKKNLFRDQTPKHRTPTIDAKKSDFCAFLSRRRCHKYCSARKKIPSQKNFPIRPDHRNRLTFKKSPREQSNALLILAIRSLCSSRTYPENPNPIWLLLARHFFTTDARLLVWHFGIKGKRILFFSSSFLRFSDRTELALYVVV